MLEHQLTAQGILHDYREQTFLPVQSAIDFAQAIAGVHHMWSLVANDSDNKGLNIWNTPTKLHYLHHLGEKSNVSQSKEGQHNGGGNIHGSVQDSCPVLFAFHR